MRLFLSTSILLVCIFYISEGDAMTTREGNVSSVATTEPSTTTEEVDDEGEEVKPPKKKRSIFTINNILFAIAGALVVSGCLVSFSLWMLSRRARAKLAEDEGESGVSPQKIESEALNLSEFQEKGPLVMQARMKGKIKHALDDDKSFSLKEVQFYPQYNEICIIGSDIEQLEGMSQMSMLSGEKSAEVAKARKGAFPTMASEMKRKEAAEAAAREAQRVKENERRIAESAIRRRARDAAAAAAAAQAASDKSKQAAVTSQTSSDKSKQDITSPDARSQKSIQSMAAVDKTQHSQKSVSRRARSRQDSVQKPPAPSYQHPPAHPPVEDHRKAPVAVARKRPSNDGRKPDALGITSAKMKKSTSSPSPSSSRRASDDSKSQRSEVKSGSRPPPRTAR